MPKRNLRLQILFDLHRICVGGDPEPTRHPLHVRVNGDRRLIEGLGQYNGGRLSTDPWEPHQIGHRVRHNPVEILVHGHGQSDDRLGLLSEEARAENDGLNVLRVGSCEIAWLRVRRHQDRDHVVDVLICGLSREHSRNDQFPRRPIVEGSTNVGIQLLQSLRDRPGMALLHLTRTRSICKVLSGCHGRGWYRGLGSPLLMSRTPSVTRPIAALLVAAALFGSTFVIVKDAVTSLAPLTFIAWRFGVAALALLVVAPPRNRRVWRDGLIAGAVLFGAFWAQTQALTETSATNSGLVTGLYVVFTPFVAAAWGRRVRIRPGVMLGTLVAFAGLALLTIRDGLAPSPADMLTLAAAVLFAVHIVYLSRVAPHHPVVPFTAVQMLVTAAGAAIAGWFVEGLSLPSGSVWLAIVLTGLLVSGGAFLLQIWAQTKVSPTLAAVVLAFEPAFATAIAGVVGEERLTLQGWIGAGLIIAAIYMVIASERDESLAEAVT